jgi:predicted negative regulator of RcsB-dependent stress response
MKKRRKRFWVTLFLFVFMLILIGMVAYFSVEKKQMNQQESAVTSYATTDASAGGTSSGNCKAGMVVEDCRNPHLEILIDGL